MALESTKYTLLAGDIKFALLDANDTPLGWENLDNYSLKIKGNSETKEVVSLMNETFGQAAAKTYIAKPDEITLEGEGLTSSILGIIFAASVVDESITGGAIVDEQHTVKALDKAIKTNKGFISAVSVKDSTGATTYTANTDYIVTDARMGLIAILSGGAIDLGDVVKVSYTNAAKVVKRIPRGAKASVNIALAGLMEDQNNAGQLYDISCNKMTITSNSELSLVGQDFLKASFMGTAISIDGQPAFTLTQYAA